MLLLTNLALISVSEKKMIQILCVVAIIACTEAISIQEIRPKFLTAGGTLKEICQQEAEYFGHRPCDLMLQRWMVTGTGERIIGTSSSVGYDIFKEVPVTIKLN